MATLTSPGVSVSIIDQSNYAPTGPGTVPFILLATASNKTSSAGGIANYTTSSTVNTLQLVTSQKDLLTNYGVPSFPVDASGNRIFGSELAEYGLMAAHSALGITNQAYVLRANVDLGALSGSSSRPYSNPDGGTVWLDTTNTSWGVFTWDATNQVFAKQTPAIISSTSQFYQSNSTPYSNVGTINSFAVVTADVKNPLYQKMYDNSWQVVGSNLWAIRTPTVTGNAQASSVNVNDIISINNSNVTIGSTSVANLVAQINGLGLAGIKAYLDTNGYFKLFANASSQSNGSTADGKIAINNTFGTPLTALGLTSGTYASPILQYSPHYNVPFWKATDAIPRPSNSVWIKTTSVNGGANMKVYRWNSSTLNWDSLSAPLYSNRRYAIYGIDPTLGGLGISNGTVFVKYDLYANTTGTYKILTWAGNGGPNVVTGNVVNPTFTAGNQFSIAVSIPGQSAYSSAYTITLSGTTLASTIQDILSANIPYLTASVSSTNSLQLSHINGGDIQLHNVSGTPLTSAGITTSLPNVFDDAGTGYLVASFWQAPSELYETSTQPTNAPSNGTLWYYSTPIEVDIMINDGSNWRGYKTLNPDTRGYNLTQTDPLGPIISATAPSMHTDGTALVYGDLWVSTANLESYPQIYRWQKIAGINQWVLIDNTDNTTENGIVFADARWDSTGTADPALDAKPSIVTMLNSSYVDLDCIPANLYPRGMLLFNTRRSSYNVKQYSAQHFTAANYPNNIGQLPAQAATWVSVSGKNTNNVPYMGRKAVRNVIVSALKSAVDNNEVVREDQINFNLLVCPGYPELTSNLIALNNDRRQTGFVIADTPMGLASDSTTVNNYVSNALGASDTGEDGLTTSDSYTAVFYPGAALTNGLDGVGSVVVPITHAILRMIIKSDQASAPWFAPAGALRGKIDNVTKIGYVDRVSGKFYSIGTNQGLRDLLYSNNVNPVAVFPTDGILNYGNHTRQATATALDRINVARLINYLRYNLERLAKPLVFEPNDTVTRNQATQAVAGLLNDIKTQRGVYDYLVVCDTTNNTPASIDRNELHIDIAIEPVKAAEFIYIPVRILNTGAISGNNPSLGGLSNSTPSISLT